MFLQKIFYRQGADIFDEKEQEVLREAFSGQRTLLNKKIMKIEHIAIWTQDLEKVKAFYTKYFKMLLSRNLIYKVYQVFIKLRLANTFFKNHYGSKLEKYLAVSSIV